MQNSYLGSALAFLLLSSTSALAQEVASTELPELSVQGASAGSLTVPSIAAQRATVNATVGSVAFVDAKDFQNRYANTLRDVLKDTPGVFVQAALWSGNAPFPARIGHLARFSPPRHRAASGRISGECRRWKR